MKKLVVLLTAIFILYIPSYAKIEVQENVAFIKTENVSISFQPVEGNTLRITASLKDSKPFNSEFYINKSTVPSTPTLKDNTIILGDTTITETSDGYILSKMGEKKYTSSFSIDGKFLREIKVGNTPEYYYGMGEVFSRLALMSATFSIRQEAKYGDQAFLYIPFYFSNSGNAFYYNANTDDKFKFGPKGKYEVTFSTQYPTIDYYYYSGDSPKNIVADFYNFSNSKSLLPKWAFGYIQSKYGYENEKQVYDLISSFKEHEIPVSAIVLDLQWFKKMGDLDWDTTNWPDYKKMDSFLEENNIKLITISEPFFTVDSKNYNEFNENKILGTYKDGKTITWGDWWCFGAPYGGIMNPIAPKALEIIGQKYINMSNSGIDAFWTDLGEPENTSPETMFNEYSEKEFHNYYNREWSKLIDTAMKKEFPNKRPFILSRSGFTGSAQYGVSIWSGDSSSNFLSLKKQAALAINSGMSGFSYWGSDVGGFISGENVPATKEVYIRWMQFGVFTPVFRAHGSQSPREPWIYGQETTKLLKKNIDFRYKILPYIYSTAYQTYKDGIPMIRALMLEHPKDPETLINYNQFYFGDYIMVTPIVSSIDKDPDVSVYLPEGNWYDLDSFEKYSSGKYTFKSILEKIPVFYKEGAIIPTTVKSQNEILLIPTSKSTTFTWYDDDGITNDFKKGQFEAIKITLDKNKVSFDNVKNSKNISLKILRSSITKPTSTSFTEDALFYYFNITLNEGNNKFIF